MSEKLAPCPFCGGNNDIKSCASWLVKDGSFWIGEIECKKCRIIVQKRGFPSDGSQGRNATVGVITAWNTRTALVEAKSKNEELQSIINTASGGCEALALNHNEPAKGDFMAIAETLKGE